MASFEYREDSFVFTVLGSNDAPLTDTKIHTLNSETVNDQSIVVPLVNGWLLVSGIGVSLLLDTVKIESVSSVLEPCHETLHLFLGVPTRLIKLFSTALAGAQYLILCSSFFENEILNSTSLCSWVIDTWNWLHVSPHVSDPTAEANFWIATVSGHIDHFETNPSS
jgi:hypothetical protein